MQAIRVNAKKIWKLKSDGVETRRHAIFIIYFMYYDLIIRHYFQTLRVLDQNSDAHINYCRRIDKQYKKSEFETYKLTNEYKLKKIIDKFIKFKIWWVAFLNIEKKSHLNKFIKDSFEKSAFHISHKYYHFFCYVASHLELILRSKNDDKTICKNGNRETKKDYNVLINYHSFNHYYLHFLWKFAFDAELQKKSK